jgi:hypothetical protein
MNAIAPRGWASRKFCAPYVCEVFWQIAGNSSAVQGGVSVAGHGYIDMIVDISISGL